MTALRFIAVLWLTLFATSAARSAPPPLNYELRAETIAASTYAIYGAQEPINASNGGAIANVAFIDTSVGVVVIDSGPSKRYGEALRAFIESRTKKPIVRVYITHFHPDHILGSQAFEPGAVSASAGAISAFESESAGFSDAMYRILGDWMRGTQSQFNMTALDVHTEKVGDHQFRFIQLNGHSSADLVILDETTGVLFSGDLVFANRAPATPHADFPAWRKSLVSLKAIPHKGLLPGHGPYQADDRAIEQTLDWLDWLESLMSQAVRDGLSMAEAASEPIPERFSNLAAARYELARSATHIYPGLEATLLPRVDNQ